MSRTQKHPNKKEDLEPFVLKYTHEDKVRNYVRSLFLKLENDRRRGGLGWLTS